MAEPSIAAPATAALAVTEAAPDFLGVTADATVSVALATVLPTPLATEVVALTAVEPAVLVASTAQQQQQKDEHRRNGTAGLTGPDQPWS
jgi:hypothetical protein